MELVAPPEGSAVGERLSLEGVAGGPYEPVTAAQMDKKKVLDKVLPVRNKPHHIFLYFKGRGNRPVCGSFQLREYPTVNKALKKFPLEGGGGVLVLSPGSIGTLLQHFLSLSLAARATVHPSAFVHSTRVTGLIPSFARLFVRVVRSVPALLFFSVARPEECRTRLICVASQGSRAPRFDSCTAVDGARCPRLVCTTPEGVGFHASCALPT